MPYSTTEKKALASRMRRYPTPTEKMLWERLRNSALGIRFQRQVLILGYIVDFYCPLLRVAIEVDGSWHRDRAEWDYRKDLRFAKEGILVVRVAASRVYKALNHTVLGIEAVCQAVARRVLAIRAKDEDRAEFFAELAVGACDILCEEPSEEEVHVGQV